MNFFKNNFNVFLKMYENNLNIKKTQQKNIGLRGHMWLLIAWLDLFKFHNSTNIYYSIIFYHCSNKNHLINDKNYFEHNYY
jgi:hypothetical protein